MRWKSSLVDEIGGYDLGQILWGIQPVTHSLPGEKTQPLGLYIPLGVG